jgi:hypothetical protein
MTTAGKKPDHDLRSENDGTYVVEFRRMIASFVTAATARGRGPRGCSIPWRLVSRRCRDQPL